MCRLAGIVNKSFDQALLERSIRLMTKSQAHGGPDDEGEVVFANYGLALGHRRLSLLDLTRLGHQPMSSTNQEHLLVYNGEIYNYQSIKADLIEKGHQFNSTSDTEVILKAYEEWGTNSFRLFKGMFAFALCDVKTSSLYLVRDPQGIKPLYYLKKNNQLYFASEVKAFLTLPFTIQKNEDWPIAFLSLGHLPEPMTTLKDVYMLTKGHYIRYGLNQEDNNENLVPKAMEYTQANMGCYGNLHDAQIAFNGALDSAIKSQLVSDADIGVFLSGGIDSSLLALQASKYQENKLVTVSIDFPEAKFSEKKYQDLISKKLPGQHIRKEISKKDFDLYFEAVLNQMDQPSTDGINTWFVSRAAREAGLKAVLSGIGADELFGGYPSFKRIAKIPLIRNFSPLVHQIAKMTKNDALKRVNYLQKSPASIYEYLFLRGFFNSEQLLQLFKITQERQQTVLDQIPEPKKVKPNKFDGKRASWFEQEYFMQNQLLKDADSMSMQHGLEIRVPFLDPDLVSLSERLPQHILFNKGLPAKHLLINAFNGILPAEIWNRPKMGFTFPFQEWLKSHTLYQQLKIRSKDNPFICQLFSDYELNKIHWSKIMSLLVLDQFEHQHQ